MKQSVWMSLGVLVILGMAANVCGQNTLPPSFSGSSTRSTQPNECEFAQCDSSNAPKGYQMTVQLLTKEALEVCQKLCQAGKYAEACYLLKKMQQLNPENQQIRQAFERVNQMAAKARSINEVQSFIRQCHGAQQQRARTAASYVQRTGATAPAAATATTPSQPPCCSTEGSCASTPCPIAKGKQGYWAFVRCAPQKRCPVTCEADQKSCCKSQCGCGSDCKCSASAVYQRPVRVTVPAAVVRSCPVLGGRVGVTSRHNAQFVTTPATSAWKVYVIVVPAANHSFIPHQRQTVIQKSVAVRTPTPVAIPARHVVRVAPAECPVSVFSPAQKQVRCPYVSMHGQQPNWVKHWRHAHPHGPTGDTVVYYMTTPNTHVSKEVFFTPATAPVWHQPVRMPH